MPKRIQRKRTKGWRKPPDAIYVGRGSHWGNPFIVGESVYLGEPITTKAEAVAAYEEALFTAGREYQKLNRLRVKEDLAGKDLMCWCAEFETCHADVLLKWANESPTLEADHA